MGVGAGPNTAMHVTITNQEPHEENPSTTGEDEGGGASITAHYSPSNTTHDEDTNMTLEEHADVVASSEAQLEVLLESSAAEAEHAFANILPTTAMSQLSQQLEQIQEAQGNEAGMGLPGHNESVHFSSTSPHSPPSLPSIASLHLPGLLQTVAHSLQSIQGAFAQMYPPPMAEMQNAIAPDTIPPFGEWFAPDIEPQPFITLNTMSPPLGDWEFPTLGANNFDQFFLLGAANFNFANEVDVDAMQELLPHELGDLGLPYIRECFGR